MARSPSDHLRAAALLAGVLAASPLHAQEVPAVQLFGSGTDRFDRFGWAVALSEEGDRLLVGAPVDYHLNPPGEFLGGRVYVFERSAVGSWVQADLWYPAVSYQSGSGVGGGDFGGALSLAPDGRLAIVGARGEGVGMNPHEVARGAAYVFRHDEAAGAWVREARLRPSGLGRYSQAGTAVAVAGDLAVMNGGPAQGGTDSHSRVTVFRRQPDATWVEAAHLPAVTHLGYGELLAVASAPDGERILVGSNADHDTGTGVAGAAFVFRNEGAAGEERWVREARLLPPSTGRPGTFGSDVALSPDGRLALVTHEESCWPDDGYPCGWLHVFRREGDGAASEWVVEARLRASQPEVQFAGRADLSGDSLALVGAGALGEVVYRREPDGAGAWTWREVSSFSISASVLSGHRAAGGFWRDSTRGETAGIAYVYELGQAVASAPPPLAPALSASVAPNPAAGAATLTLGLPAAGPARVAVYDLLGREVALLYDGLLGAGAHRLGLAAGRLAPGLYLVRVEAAAGAVVRRLAVTR
jgi:hypothetical protein